MQRVTGSHSADKKTFLIKVGGEFVQGMRDEFRHSYANIKPIPDIFEVDLSEVNFVDSSGLGMLLLLNEHAKMYSAVVVLAHPTTKVLNLLQTAKFDTIFEVKP